MKIFIRKDVPRPDIEKWTCFDWGCLVSSFLGLVVVVILYIIFF